MESKVCTGCKIEKPLEDFSRHPVGRGGKNPKCKQCRNEWSSEKYSRTPQEEVLARKRTYWKEVKRFSQYGITKEIYLEMVQAQDGLCLICTKRFDVDLVIDHDHDTGKVRGLLCDRCNSGLGFFEDSTEGLRRAIKYLAAEIG